MREVNKTLFQESCVAHRLADFQRRFCASALTFKVQARRVVGDDGVNILPDMVLSILEVAQ